MEDSLLPEMLPAVLLSNIVRLYYYTYIVIVYSSYMMCGYLPATLNSINITSEEKDAVQINTIKLFPKVHYS